MKIRQPRFFLSQRAHFCLKNVSNKTRIISFIPASDEGGGLHTFLGQYLFPNQEKGLTSLKAFENLCTFTVRWGHITISACQMSITPRFMRKRKSASNRC